MATIDSAFSGSIPAIYDRWLVPLLFEPWADDLAARAAALNPSDVLETAAGTGVVTERLARLLPNAHITATDLNPAMIERAVERAPRVATRAADAQALPFADAAFDLVLCQFGVMFYPDRIAAQREARRVLRPGGRYIFNVWDRIDRNPVSQTVADAGAALFPEEPPRFLDRTPFGHYDTDRLAEELKSVGFTGVSVETLEKRNGRVGAYDAAEGLCRGTPLSMEINAHGSDAMVWAVEAAAAQLAPLIGDDGKIDAPMTAHVLTAIA
jgi:ubiquinone/menaquinone biosynthesis C-methylase UbiE